jgi:hypothetical protein
VVPAATAAGTTAGDTPELSPTRVFEISGAETDVRIDELTIADGMAAGTEPGLSGDVTLGGGVFNVFPGGISIDALGKVRQRR